MYKITDKHTYAMAGSKVVIPCKLEGNETENTSQNVTWSLTNGQKCNKSNFANQKCFKFF